MRLSARRSPGCHATFFAAVVLAPFLEECSKAFPLFYRHGETTKSIFTLGLLVGLGFGIFEFFIYILVLNAPILSRLSGILFHAASTSITAYGIATNRTLPFYLIAVALHSSHNFFASLIGLSLNDPTGVNALIIGTAFSLMAALLISMSLYNKVRQKTHVVIHKQILIHDPTLIRHRVYGMKLVCSTG